LRPVIIDLKVLHRGQGCIYLTLTAFAVSANAVPPLLSTIARDLALPPWTIGACITLQFSAFAAISFLGEKIRRRFDISLKTLITIGLVLVSLALISAPLILTGIASILPWILVLGCAGGLVETSSSVLLAGPPDDESSKPLCLSQAFYAIGAFGAPVAAKACMEGSGGWKVAFLLFGAFALLVAILYILSYRGLAPDPSEPHPDARASRSAVGVALFFAALIFVYVVAESLSGSWMPFMLEELRGLDAPRAASLSSLFWLGMVLGRLAIVVLPKRLGMAPALVAGSVAGALCALLLGVGGQGATLVAFGFCMGPIWPVTVKVASAALGSASRAGAVIATGGLGAAIGPLVGSLLVGEGLTRYYFCVLSALCILVPCIVAAALSAGKKGEA
jgi:fucose permease